MEESQKDLELIDRYLEGVLAEEEQAVVEQRLQEDTEFKAMFEDIKSLTKGIEELGNAKLKRKFKELDANLGNPLKDKKVAVKEVNWTRYIGWAAVLVAGLFSIIYFSSRSQISHEGIYEDYFAIYDNVVVPTKRGVDSLELINQAFAHYDTREYAAAALVFEEILKKDKTEYIQFYYAMTLMEQQDWEGAKLILEGLLSGGENFIRQSKWYLALTYIRLKEEEQSRSLLNSLIEDGTSYAEAAGEIMERIN